MKTKQWLDKYYPGSAPSGQMVEKWIGAFKRSRTGTEGAVHSGCPYEAVLPENIKKIHNIFLNDRKVKLLEIASAVRISEYSAYIIVHEH